MVKKKIAVLALGVVALVMLTMAGCTAKKHLATIEDQKGQLEQADSRINELQKNNEALDKSLKDTMSALDGVKQDIGKLKGQIAALEKDKTELASAVAAGKESEESFKKKTRSLNGLIGALKKDLAEKEALIASKDAEAASSLQAGEAALKAAAEDQNRNMAALNTEKDVLASQLEKTVSDKNRLIKVLAVLLGLAVILAVVGFVRGRKTAAAG